MELLSIQSSVAFGHVGNSAAVFPLQRLGIEAWPVNTVHFSNHTGYGEWRGPLLSADDVREVIHGVEERGVLGRRRRGAQRLPGRPRRSARSSSRRSPGSRQLNPAAVYCCDPVMGDVGRGMFVQPGHPGADARPGRPGRRRDHAQPLRARVPRRHRDPHHGRPARRRRRRAAPRPGTVLVTSVLTDETPGGLGRRGRGLATTAPGRAVRRCCRSTPTAAATSPRRVFLAHLLTHGVGRDGAAAGDLDRLRHAREDARGGHPRDRAGRRRRT